MARVPLARLGDDITIDLDVITVGPVLTIQGVMVRNAGARDARITMRRGAVSRTLTLAAGTMTEAVRVLDLTFDDEPGLSVAVRLA